MEIVYHKGALKTLSATEYSLLIAIMGETSKGVSTDVIICNHPDSIPQLPAPPSPFHYFLEVHFYETSRLWTLSPQPSSGPLLSAWLLPSSIPSSAHQTCSG